MDLHERVTAAAPHLERHERDAIVLQVSLTPVLCRNCHTYVPLGWALDNHGTTCGHAFRTQAHSVSERTVLVILDTVVNAAQKG